MTRQHICLFLINITGVVPDEGQWLHPPRPSGLRLMACPGSLSLRLHVNNGSIAVRQPAQTHLAGCSGAPPRRLDEAGGEIKYIDLGGEERWSKRAIKERDGGRSVCCSG